MVSSSGQYDIKKQQEMYNIVLFYWYVNWKSNNLELPSFVEFT